MIGPAALVVTAVATGVQALTVHPAYAPLRLALVLISYGAFAAMLAAHHVRPFLTRRLVLAAFVPLLALVVVIPPHGSNDLWAYVMYGRTVSVHHRSPYRFAPDQVGPDPMLARVDARWRHQRAVYGPVFVATAAALTHVAGTSPIAERLTFQLLAALLALGCVLLVGKKTGDPAAMAWLGLNPGLALFVVNLGHNDMLVGAAVLVGTLVAARRPALAGAVVGLGALVKIIGALVLVALAVSIGRSVSRRAGAIVLSAGAGVVIIGYLLAGGLAAIDPLRNASHWRTPASLATALQLILPRSEAIVASQLVVAAAVGILLVRGNPHPQWLVVAAVAVFLLGAPYVLPWYAAWVLPVAALAWRSRLALLLAVQSAVVAVISVDGRTISPTGLHVVLSTLARTALPAFEVAGLAALVAMGCIRRRNRATESLRPV